MRRRAQGGNAEAECTTVTRSNAPASEEKEQKSFTVDRYHFRKDGAGYECREVIGKGRGRKRPYLAYLSKATFDQLRTTSKTPKDLQDKIVDWASNKKREKGGKES
jgi:hypothetical protein